MCFEGQLKNRWIPEDACSSMMNSSPTPRNEGTRLPPLSLNTISLLRVVLLARSEVLVRVKSLRPWPSPMLVRVRVIFEGAPRGTGAPWVSSTSACSVKISAPLQHRSRSCNFLSCSSQNTQFYSGPNLMPHPHNPHFLQPDL